MRSHSTHLAESEQFLHMSLALRAFLFFDLVCNLRNGFPVDRKTCSLGMIPYQDSVQGGARTGSTCMEIEGQNCSVFCGHISCLGCTVY